MYQANNPHTSQSQFRSKSLDEQTEFENILRSIAHSFEGNTQIKLQHLQFFVDYFRDCNKILDVGCGEGLMLELLQNAGIRAIGIDIDHSKVNIACSKELEAIVADADEYLRDKTGEFDGIFLRHIIEHFDGPDGVHLLYLCRRALRPGGRIVVVTPNFQVPEVVMQIFWLDITHKRPYPMRLLRCIFTTLGINITGSGVCEEPTLDLFMVGQVP